MGSIAAACLSGYLCRLCSEMHRTVIHIYGDLGRERDIAHKINAYLPVTISRSDRMPKTICKECMDRVEEHHELILRLANNIAKYTQQRDIAKQPNQQPIVELVDIGRLPMTTIVTSSAAPASPSTSTSPPDALPAPSLLRVDAMSQTDESAESEPIASSSD